MSLNSMMYGGLGFALGFLIGATAMLRGRKRNAEDGDVPTEEPAIKVDRSGRTGPAILTARAHTRKIRTQFATWVWSPSQNKYLLRPVMIYRDQDAAWLTSEERSDMVNPDVDVCVSLTWSDSLGRWRVNQGGATWQEIRGGDDLQNHMASMAACDADLSHSSDESESRTVALPPPARRVKMEQGAEMARQLPAIRAEPQPQQGQVKKEKFRYEKRYDYWQD